MKNKTFLGFIATSSLLLSTSWAFAGAITGTSSSRPNTYNITIEKAELCQSAACSNPFLLGSTTGTFDISSATAGADVGKLIDISGIPLYQTWSHVRVTVSTTFSMAATGACQTNGTNVTNRATPFTGGGGYANSGAGGGGALQTMILPNQAVIRAVGGGLAAYDYTTNGITQTDGASNFTMTIAMSSPYTCTGVMPRIEVQFDTSTAFGYDAGCNFAFPQPPTITITATDP